MYISILGGVTSPRNGKGVYKLGIDDWKRCVLIIGFIAGELLIAVTESQVTLSQV